MVRRRSIRAERLMNDIDWKIQLDAFYELIKINSKLIEEAHRRIESLNQRLNVIEKRKPQIREFLQN